MYLSSASHLKRFQSGGVKLNEWKIKFKDIVRFQDLMRMFVDYIIIIISVKLMVCSDHIKLSEALQTYSALHHGYVIYPLIECKD